MQNAIKHGGTVRSIVVEIVDEGRRLTFTVTDDGRGFDAGNGNGNGITNMRDRLAAVGGRLTISFPRSGGTSVRGSIPVEKSASRAQTAGEGPELTGRTA
jgi:signal transduction histidine kinase